MKKRLSILIACMLLCAAFAPAASADGLYAVPAPAAGGLCAIPAPCVGGFTSFTGYINGYRINIRSNPGTTYPVCGIASCGDSICVTSQSYGAGGRLWYYGRVGCVSGWVYSGYVSGAPIPASAMTAVTVCTVPSGYGTICMNATNFRSGPGLYYVSLMQLSRGTVVQLLSAVTDCSGVVWYQVLTGGCAGWVRSDLITATGCGGGCMPSPYTSAACFAGYTNTCAVNVRATPNGTKIAQVSRGTVVYVTGIVCSCGVYWYQVTFYGGAGYIRADLVTIGTASYPSCGIPSVGGIGSGSSSVMITGGLSDSYGVGSIPSAGVDYGFGTGSVPSAGIDYGFGTGSVPSAGADYGFGTGSVPSAGADYGNTVPSYDQNAAGTYPNGTVTAVPDTVFARPALSFVTCSLTPGQTLPVYTAPNAASLRADNGTAQVTLTESLYAAGFDGQWLMVLYRNQDQMSRVGYINAFQLQGALPSLQSLSFSTGLGLVTCRTAVTSDPMEQTDALMMLNSGDSVTWLATLSLNGEWAYIETMYNGTPVRGFVPAGSLR